MREYVWLGTDSGANGAEKWCHKVDDNGNAANNAFLYLTRKNDDDNKSVANIELHFYKAGTNTEVDFHGVVGMNDFEKGEQYKMVQGGGQVYLNNSTLLSKLADKTWGVASTSDEDAENDKYELWVEVDGTSNKPLKFQYMVDGDYSIAHSYRGSGMMMSAVTVSYELIGDVPSGVIAPVNDIVTQYGKIAPASVKSVDGYTFDGWYYDQALTNKVGTITDKINGNTTLYGKYVKNEEKSSGIDTRTPDTGLFTSESGFSKFGGVAAVAGAITAGLTGYVVYKNRKHLFRKVGFGRK